MDLMYIPILQCLHLSCWSATSFVVKTEEKMFCFGCYNVIPGWDQESDGDG